MPHTVETSRLQDTVFPKIERWLTCSARASKSPNVPPQTATSQSIAAGSLLWRTLTTAGPLFGGAVFIAYNQHKYVRKCTMPPCPARKQKAAFVDGRIAFRGT